MDSCGCRTGLLTLLILSLIIVAAHANCTVQNKSSKDIIVIPVSVSITINIAAGTSAQLPPSQQNCKFKNAGSGNESSPVALVDGTIYVVIDGAITGTVDLYVGSLLNGVIQLGISIFASL